MRIILIICISIVTVFPALTQDIIKWHTIEEAFELTKEKPKKIMIDVYTDWCSWCKVMDTTTFRHPVIANYINKNFYAVKLNAEQKTDIVLDGRSYKYIPSGRRGYNELAALLLNGKLGYPSIVFLDEKANMIQPVQGYIKAKPFDQIIKFIGDDTFKTTTWEVFQASYVSPIE